MPKSQYVYILKIATDFDPTRPDSISDDDRRTLDRHFTYLKALTDDGTMILVGRTQEREALGIAILEAESEDEARAIMEGDPAITSGLMTGTLHPFRIALARAAAEDDEDSEKSDGGIH